MASQLRYTAVLYGAMAACAACGTSAKDDSASTLLPVKADILFVLDNSSSMSEEAGDLGANADALIAELRKGRGVDYRLGITTTTPDDLASDGLDAGEAGRLIGLPVSPDTPEPATVFREQVLCQTIYWPVDTPMGDPVTECSSAPEEGVTQAYLDCVCDGSSWQSTREGSGTEEHLESALMALCRSVPDAPATCRDNLSVFGTTSDIKNEGFVRAGSTIVVVIVSDEGDSSRRIPSTGTETDLATPYLNAFAELDNPIQVVAIGPLYDPAVDSQPRCIEGAGFGGYLVDRLIHATEATGGLYRPIVEQTASGCEPTSFMGHFEALGALIRGA